MIHNSIMDILGLAISLTEKYLHLKNEQLPIKKHQKTHLRTRSLSEDEDTLETISQETSSVSEEEFVEFVKYLDDRFLRAVPFIRSGLKGNARAAEFPTLGILAASLEAGIR